MTAFGPTSLDLLATQGVIPCDAQAFVTGIPSPYLQQCGVYTPPNPELYSIPPIRRQPVADAYRPEAAAYRAQPVVNNVPKKKNSGIDVHTVKTVGAAALVTYILGIICSKGKKNPIEGLKGIYNVAAGVVKTIGKVFKKS